VIAALANSLAVHLWECWPVRGQGEPVAGPPTNVTSSDLHRHLLNLKTVLFRFLPPTNVSEEGAWLLARARVLQAPAVAAALGQIERACDRMIDQFGTRACFACVDGNFKAVLTPTLNTVRPWEPPEGRPMPEIDPQDIRALGWAATKLLQTPGVEQAVQGQAQAQKAPEEGRGQKDKRPDKPRGKSQKVPRNPDVCKLINKANRKENRDRALIDLAREIAENDETKAQSMVRQARRFPGLFDRPDR
jgi:hypothetical protein